MNYQGITVTGVSVEGAGGSNNIGTFWQQSDVDLSRGMDFTPRGAVFARFTHLQHQPFSYRIEVRILLFFISLINKYAYSLG